MNRHRQEERSDGETEKDREQTKERQRKDKARRGKTGDEQT